MSHGYSMKHIGITIVISLAVVVLISPLLRPKGTAGAGRGRESGRHAGVARGRAGVPR